MNSSVFLQVKTKKAASGMKTSSAKRTKIYAPSAFFLEQERKK